MAEIPKQGIAVDTNHGQHTERKQGHCGHHNPDSAGHGDHKQDRITCQNQQDHCFHCIPGLQHTAEDFAGVRIVRRNGVNVVVFFLFQVGHLPIL